MLYLPILKGAPSIDFVMYTCPTFIKGLQSCLRFLSTKTVEYFVVVFSNNILVFEVLYGNFEKYSKENILAAVFIQENHFGFYHTCTSV